MQSSAKSRDIIDKVWRVSYLWVIKHIASCHQVKFNIMASRHWNKFSFAKCCMKFIEFKQILKSDFKLVFRFPQRCCFSSNYFAPRCGDDNFNGVIIIVGVTKFQVGILFLVKSSFSTCSYRLVSKLKFYMSMLFTKI